MKKELANEETLREEHAHNNVHLDSPIDVTVKHSQEQLMTELPCTLSGELTDDLHSDSPIDLTMKHSWNKPALPHAYSEELGDEMHLESQIKPTGNNYQEEPALSHEEGIVLMHVNMDIPDDQNYCQFNARLVHLTVNSLNYCCPSPSFKSSSALDEELKLPRGWFEWKSYEQSKIGMEYGPPATSSFYELYRLENKEIVVLKSIVVDHVTKTVQTFVLGNECFSEPQPFKSNHDLNLIMETFDAKGICDGVRDEKFYNIPIPLDTGYFAKEVWRSNK